MTQSGDTDYDRRLTPARGDIAAAHLEGRVKADRYVAGQPMQVSAACAGIRKTPDVAAQLESQALMGDMVTIYDRTPDCWGWGQLESDGYVGWFRLSDLSSEVHAPTHHVSVLRTIIFSEPDLKSAPVGMISLNAGVTVIGREDHYVSLATGGYMHAGHLSDVRPAVSDFVEAALWHRGAPYLWGGKDSLGLDCSGLVQSAMRAAGFDMLRDADMQEHSIGETVSAASGLTGLQRGDLVFWAGHVGIMADADNLIHANAHHMACQVEPLSEAAARILAQTKKAVRTIKRPSSLSLKSAG